MASDVTQKKTKKKKKTTPLVWIIPLLLLAIALGAGVYGFLRTYYVVGGQFIRRDATEVDLREKDFSPESFEQLRAELPDCHVLWSVPLSGGAFDCTAESIAPTAWSGEDIALLGYFENLRSIDATAADMTAADYQQLQAAVPECAIRWSVIVGGERFANDAQELTLHSLSEADLENFQYFTALRSVDARACTDYDAIIALRDRMPELAMQWSVPFSGQDYPQDATSLTVDDPSVTVEELTAVLRWLPQVESVNAPEAGWTEEEKETLRASYPELTFSWPVTILGTLYPWDTTQIDLSGRTLTAGDIQELAQKGSGLPYVEHIDLTGCGVGLTDEMLQLREAFPTAEIVFDFEVCGVPINSMDTFVDFTGIPMESTDAVEAMLPFMPKLEKVDMSDCGFDDETMDALNKKYENVRFVWTMHITAYNIRTDDLGFCGSLEYYGNFTQETIHKLTYCEDMICLDLGHRTMFEDISFLYEMPQVQFLILADSRVKDITPIGSLKNLIYLEIILSYTEDLSPLKNCESLLDLDVCFNWYTDPTTNFDTFSSLAGHLERLWYSNSMIDQARQQELADLMPNTLIKIAYSTEYATAMGWRTHERYFQMRDLIGAFYMDESGNRIYYRIVDGERVPLTEEEIANQKLRNGPHKR